MESRDIALGRGYRKRGMEHSNAMCTGRETQDSTGSTGSTRSEHGNMHRLGKGQDTQDYYTMNNRKRVGTWQQPSSGAELGSGILGGCGCRDSELAILFSNVTWVLRDVTVFPPQGPPPEVLRYAGTLGVLPWRMANVGNEFCSRGESGGV